MPKSFRSLAYRSWEAMKARCDNPNNNKYYAYGAQGISYIPKWKTFAGFLEDMGERPFGTSLERLDSAKGYCRENCKWVTIEEQNRNRRVPKNTSSGVKGVSWQKSTGRWFASSKLNGRSYGLYNGSDFFEAICARKSWENKAYFSSKES